MKPGDRWPAGCWLVVLFLWLLPTCYTPDDPAAAAEPEPEPRQGQAARALCVPEPEPGAELRGRIADAWDPACGELLAVPCERGVTCSASANDCSCVCDLESDCRALALGFEHYGGPAGRSSACELGRCVWGHL